MNVTNACCRTGFPLRSKPATNAGVRASLERFLVIQSYGVHWHIDRVFWGRPGTLLGAASRSPKARPVDFRYQRGIYALYADYELVYVGQTGAKNDRLFNRLKCHKQDHLSERWNRFSWFGTQWVTTAGNLFSGYRTCQSKHRGYIKCP